MLMNLPSTDSWKYKTYLLLSHLKGFFSITVCAQGECCSFQPEGQCKFALYSLLFVKVISFYPPPKKKKPTDEEFKLYLSLCLYPFYSRMGLRRLGYQEYSKSHLITQFYFLVSLKFF